ncbi:uncharacterized protein LOC18445260 isoform X1 [Amborella trichopoda]|uniref:uncharacterized protein LOC18445260 isoform X1 n=1 Tax=Amborella trichopoda TaxID=13333 RepID=UPI0005D3819A|nr:uncharacterized protein LOC18445260 isoform X1 [Amborella trichopoda]XP_020529842.1 uncharacterized protein LOC18445260 isoform X1 [Amborella trichopoda]|eukprot:XP_011627424.1 uncharacterized protein LOC18445260 isoform X1 [Amborella trichopoda]
MDIIPCPLNTLCVGLPRTLRIGWQQPTFHPSFLLHFSPPLNILNNFYLQSPKKHIRPGRITMDMSIRSSSSPTVTDTPRSEGLEASPSGFVGEKDMLIVGPGVLGRIVAEKWRQENPGCKIYGQTMTLNHHEELLKLGIHPCLKGSQVSSQFPYVIFCAPPGPNVDYPGEVRLATSYWNGKGAFLFTSSSSPYACDDNGFCNEDSPVVPIGRSPGTDVLLKAESAVLEAGGCVLRLAGLYKSDRGAHIYWLKKGTVETRPDYVLNLIHYEDAASLSVAILKKKLRGRIFLGCDSHPLSSQELMDYVNKSGKFSKKFLGFVGTDGPLGKRLDNSKTRAELGWQPKYESFAKFLGLSE